MQRLQQLRVLSSPLLSVLPGRMPMVMSMPRISNLSSGLLLLAMLVLSACASDMPEAPEEPEEPEPAPEAVEEEPSAEALANAASLNELAGLLDGPCGGAPCDVAQHAEVPDTTDAEQMRSVVQIETQDTDAYETLFDTQGTPQEGTVWTDVAVGYAACDPDITVETQGLDWYENEAYTTFLIVPTCESVDIQNDADAITDFQMAFQEAVCEEVGCADPVADWIAQ